MKVSRALTNFCLFKSYQNADLDVSIQLSVSLRKPRLLLGFCFLEMFYTYILYSKKLNSFYKGETGNITDRLNRHNSGYEKATQTGVPWILVWKGEKATKSEEKLLERKLKNLSVKRTFYQQNSN